MKFISNSLEDFEMKDEFKKEIQEEKKRARL